MCLKRKPTTTPEEKADKYRAYFDPYLCYRGFIFSDASGREMCAACSQHLSGTLERFHVHSIQQRARMSNSCSRCSKAMCREQPLANCLECSHRLATTMAKYVFRDSRHHEELSRYVLPLRANIPAV